jgi:curved DNA-binding protein CbpA
MTTAKNEEIKGTFFVHSFADLLAESVSNRLSGSFRLSNGENKIIVYLRSGKVVYAVSNSRQHRLFQLMLNWGQINQSTLSQFPDFANDLIFAQKLVENNLFTKFDLDAICKEQVVSILNTAFAWETGEWSFSHLARIKDGINYEVDSDKILIEVGRNASDLKLAQKFNGGLDVFSANPNLQTSLNLTSEEAFVFSRITYPTKINEVKSLCGFQHEKVLKILYSLWIGGFLKRENYHTAFSAEQIERMLSAKLRLTENIVSVNDESNEEIVEVKVKEPINQEPELEKNEEELLEEFLQRAENSISHYQVLGVEQTDDVAKIKQQYFYLAKNFHPDKYHAEVGSERHKRLQNAFTQTSQAYETLKDNDSRELYDFKLKRKLANLEKQNLQTTMATNAQEKQKQDEAISEFEKEDMARRCFDQGFEFLMQKDFDSAVTLLARAVLLEDDSAKFHAYYGKALGNNPKYKFQAEQEIQKAIKIDSKNTLYRVMLAELYIGFNLIKRAEGELNRILSQEPNHKEAQNLLASLKNI